MSVSVSVSVLVYALLRGQQEYVHVPVPGQSDVVHVVHVLDVGHVHVGRVQVREPGHVHVLVLLLLLQVVVADALPHPPRLPQQQQELL